MLAFQIPESIEVSKAGGQRKIQWQCKGVLKQRKGGLLVKWGRK